VNLEEYRQMYEIENTHWYFRGKKTLLRKLLKATLQSEKRYRILDVGCGTGNILLMLREFGEAVGVDSSDVALEFCRTRNLTDLHLTSPGAALPFPDGSFDVVCAFDLLEHLENDLQCLNEMKRVLRKHGKIIITVPAHPYLWSDHDVALHHKRRYTRKTLDILIAEANLDPIRITFLNSFLFPMAVGVRTAKKFFGKNKSQAKSDFFITLPYIVNASLLKCFEMEAAILPQFDLPFGLTLLAVCQQKD